MIRDIIRLTILRLGGVIRCQRCGTKVNKNSVVAHCNIKHPELMR